MSPILDCFHVTVRWNLCFVVVTQAAERGETAPAAPPTEGLSAKKRAFRELSTSHSSASC